MNKCSHIDCDCINEQRCDICEQLCEHLRNIVWQMLRCLLLTQEIKHRRDEAYERENLLLWVLRR